MAERALFLSTAFGAYHHRARPADDEELTRVGPGTPCGEYLRRFWQPVVLSEESRDLPQRLRIMGEDLVAFRDRGGAVGLLELHCPHRGTSLEFGLISDKGIRCCYHGWLFDVDGTILETPGEPADSTLKDRLFHGAYPVREYQGLVFAYTGPPDKEPDFPILIPMTCPATGWSPASPPCGSAIGCRSRKTAWTRRIWPFSIRFLAARGLPRISARSANGTGWRPRTAWSTSTPAGKATVSGFGSPISSPQTFTNFRRTPTRWPSAQRSTARRPRHGRFPSTTPTRCRSDSTAHPRARNHGGVRASGRMRAGPTKTGSGSPAITMRKSASMAASPGTVSNTSPRPIGV